MYLLFDIGGTKTRLSVSKDLETFVEPVIFDTPENFDNGIALISKNAAELCHGEKIEAAAGGIKGVLDKEKTKLVAAPGLIQWLEKPLKAELARIFNAPVFFENDSSVVGLGEAIYGAGKGHGIVAYITISTGVGGAKITGGRIDENALGFEPGHQIIDFDGTYVCSYCGIPGHLEEYVSGRAFEKRYGKKPYEITDEKIWEETARFLAYGVNNVIVHWSPDIVVLGGSMMKKIGIPVERVRSNIENILKIFPVLPAIEKAALGDIGGLYGALALLKQNLKLI